MTFSIKNNRNKFYFVLLVLVGYTLIGCQNKTLHQNAIIFLSPTYIYHGSNIKLLAVAEGVDEANIQSYFWSTQYGIITDVRVKQPDYIAPTDTTVLTDTLQVVIVTLDNRIYVGQYIIFINTHESILITPNTPLPTTIVATLVTPSPTVPILDIAISTPIYQSPIIPTTTLVKNKEPMLVFASDRDGDWEIYTVNLTTFETKQLTTNDHHNDANPDWSPDGSKIVFESNRDRDKGTGYDLYIMNADGTNQQPIINELGDQFGPTWSFDGTQIAFQSNKNGNQIYVLEIGSPFPKSVTENQNQNFAPTWSPDGTQIAFFTGESAGISSAIKIVNVDTPSTEREIIRDGWSPDWSPDGTQLLYANHTAKTIGIFNFSNGENLFLTQDFHVDIEPVWSADGQWIAFSSDRAGQENRKHIYIMKPDGTGLKQVTFEGNDQQPSWRP